MKRLLVLLTVALAMVAMLAVTALPAFATIHPLSRGDRSNAPVDTQNPPGLSRLGSQNFAQPVSSVLPAGTCLTPQQTGEAQTICGTNPSPNGTAASHAFENPVQ